MRGNIYKIIHKQSNLVYVGSTINELRHRWQHHKFKYNYWLEGKEVKSISIYKYFKKYGIENFQIILIKQYEVFDKRQLEAYETLWISKLKAVNEVLPFSIRFLKRRQYYIDNKDTKIKEYYVNNIKQIRETNHNWYERNKEKMKQYHTEYREVYKSRYVCASCQYENSDKYKYERHLKSKRHQEREKLT